LPYKTPCFSNINIITDIFKIDVNEFLLSLSAKLYFMQMLFNGWLKAQPYRFIPMLFWLKSMGLGMNF